MFLSANNILLKNFKFYGKSLAESLKEHAKSIATKKSTTHIYLDNFHTRKETSIKSIVEESGEPPGVGWQYYRASLHLPILFF